MNNNEINMNTELRHKVRMHYLQKRLKEFNSIRKRMYCRFWLRREEIQLLLEVDRNGDAWSALYVGKKWNLKKKELANSISALYYIPSFNLSLSMYLAIIFIIQLIKKNSSLKQFNTV